MKAIWESDFGLIHAEILARSFKHYTRRDLLVGDPAGIELAQCLFAAPFALLSHGTEADPILNYGNRVSLALWEMSWEEFTQMPSRLTAEASNREERARLLAAVTARGFTDDYSGVRISKTGRRFKIARATIWNLLKPDGTLCGQAASFDHWEFV